MELQKLDTPFDVSFALSQKPPTPIRRSEPVSKSSPGRWRHPAYEEIVRRQKASTFSERDFQRVSVHAALLLLSFIFNYTLTECLQYVGSFTPNPLSAAFPNLSFSQTTLLVLRLYHLLNILLSLKPFLPRYRNDEILDIPLTPTQRDLLGLPPSPAPALSPKLAQIPPTSLRSRSNTPTSHTDSVVVSPSSSPQYITPPRYRRNSPPRYRSPRQHLSWLQRRSSLEPSSTINSDHGPYSSPRSFSSTSPYAGSTRDSPFFRSSANTGTNNGYPSTPTPSGPSSGLKRSQSMRESVAAASGSPNSPLSRRKMPGVNYKWLYEKESRSLARASPLGLDLG